MKLGLLMVSALGLFVCSSSGCEKAKKGGSAAEDNLAPNEVKLTGAGVDPKTQLRYQVEKGTSVTLDMVMNISIDAGGMPVPQMPTIRMSMVETCTDVEAGGAMRFDVKVGDISADGSGPMASAMDMVKDMMKNMSYQFRLAPNGKIDDVKVEGLTGPMADMGNQMKQSIEQFAAPLPDEPVGKGSTWKFKRTGEAAGIKMVTVNAFELANYKDDVVTFNVDGLVTAPPQTLSKGGATLELEKVEGKVVGMVVSDLRRFAPSGKFDYSLKVSMKLLGRVSQMSIEVRSEIFAR